MTEFGALNWSILAAYVIGNLFLGYLLSKRINTAEDFYLGRRTTPWWAIGISVVATYVSALSFLGAPAWSYTEGLSVIAIHLNYPLVIFLVITFFLPFFYNSGVASIYEYQERRFGRKARGLISTIWLVNQSLTSAAILYATSLVLEFITGIDVVNAIVIVTVVALVYTALGGITAVIWTDVIQSGILFIGAFLIFFALLENLPGGLVETLGALKAQGKLQALDPSVELDAVTTVWSGLVAMTLFHVTVYGTNQMMVQRTLASKNIGDAKKAYLLMGFSAFFIYFLFIFMGVLFYAYYGGREFDNGNTIILQFAADYGLPGLMGIIAAAVMAASMSSLDSAFNSLSTVATEDFYRKYFRRNESPEHYLRVSRWFTLFWALIIIIPAILYSRSEGSILETLSRVGSFFVGAQLGMFALGFFSKHATERGLLLGTVVGFGMVWFVAAQTELAWPWFCVSGAATTIIVGELASRLLDGKQTQWPAYSVAGQIATFRDEGREERDGRWYRVPGKVDAISYLLLVFLALSLVALWALQNLIPEA